jgi:hypothetical protein
MLIQIYTNRKYLRNISCDLFKTLIRKWELRQGITVAQNVDSVGNQQFFLNFVGDIANL